MYIIKSNEGYWNNEIGWVEDKESATYFVEEEKEIYDLPYSMGGSEWVKID